MRFKKVFLIYSYNHLGNQMGGTLYFMSGKAVSQTGLNELRRSQMVFKYDFTHFNWNLNFGFRIETGD
jgi:hypothetical protein